MYSNLKLQLWKTGIRQNRLAQDLGIDETVLSRIVNGFREANPQLRRAIAELLACDEEWLFAESEPGLPPRGRNRTTAAGADDPHSPVKAR